MSCAVSPQVRAVMEKLLADARVQKAFAFIDADQHAKIAELKEIALLHGAPFAETELRSPMCRNKLEQYGLADCTIDSEGNAFGRIGGKGARPLVALEAHLDTVFAKDTPLAITEKDGRLYCPGIGDDSAGLANVFCALRAIRHAGLRPVGGILAGGIVGEEGEGDIRGIKALLRENTDIDAVVSVEPGKVEEITCGAVGSRRYEFVFKGPGGHSWSAYGLPSPLHAMGRAMAKMAAVETPENPKTTYTIGTVTGGTSVNSIANEGRMKLDMRSVSPDALADVEKILLRLAREGVAEENSFRAKSGKEVTLEIIPIGDRPAGVQEKNSLIMQAAWAANEALGSSPKFLPPSSTNINAPLSIGIPGVVARTGGNTGSTHALDEWFSPEGSQAGVKHLLLLVFALAGLEGATEPLL